MMVGRFLRVSDFFRDVRGAAAVEYVLMLPLIITPLIGMVDLGIFVVQRMQVDAASQGAAAIAWYVCDDPTLPATQTNCAGGGGDLAGKITAAVQSTTLSTNASLASTPVVGYYCATDAGELESVSDTWAIDSTTPEAKPADCSAAVAGSATAPGQYIQVTVNYTYTPVFGVLLAAGILPETITRTSWRRIS
jgi:Flp pilus assembly protein TadG